MLRAIALSSLGVALGAGHCGAHSGHAHGASQQCACTQGNPTHPFTIDCSDAATIRAATTTLETTCTTANTYEWGGIFSTPANAYKWVAQAKGSPRAWADPSMKLVVFASDCADSEHLLEFAQTASTLMAGTCTPISDAGSIPVPTAAGACYTLTFPASTTEMFDATLDTTGVAHVAFFAEHVPTEFEFDTHYFMSTDLATDIEPVAQTDPQEYNCRFHTVNGVNSCAQAFYIIQAHHDYCPHDTLTRYEEELFHAWESKCEGCSIRRRYNAALNACPVIDCSDTTVAQLGYSHLQENCVAADTTYAFEFAGVFATPGNAYTWVSQGATVNTSLATNYTYADAEMKIVAIAMTNGQRSALHALKDTADTLMSSGSCPPVTMACTPGAVCAGQPSMTPTTAGVCKTIQFPATESTLADFMMTIDTSSASHVAFFTAHMPTEFERDMHYFMSTDLATDIEPAATLGAAVAHDHGRRLSEKPVLEKVPIVNERNSRRRLANSGSCCNNATQQGAWKQVVAYHDYCHHSAVPTYIEVGFHDYEASCENYFCNLAAAFPAGTTDPQLVCSSSPPAAPPPPSPSPAPPGQRYNSDGTLVVVSTGISSGTLIAVIIIAAVAVGLALICIMYMISKEKAGKPVFTNLSDGQVKGAA